ncbi:MAG: hypothetical protein HY585_05260, partial [Candidatus Omnitrophica bacterium]|nr:hypothetical protein [Candidatus Omnitrophota bacterium]
MMAEVPGVLAIYSGEYSGQLPQPQVHRVFYAPKEGPSGMIRVMEEHNRVLGPRSELRVEQDTSENGIGELRTRAQTIVSKITKKGPSQTELWPEVRDRVRERFRKNQKEGRATTLLITGPNGTSKTTNAHVLAQRLRNDPDLHRAKIRRVVVIEGDRSRYELAPLDLVMSDGKLLATHLAQIKKRFPQFEKEKEKYDTLTIAAEREMIEDRLKKDFVQPVENLNEELTRHGFRPYDINGEISPYIHRQFDEQDHIRFWRGGWKQIPPEKQTFFDQSLTFYDWTSRGRLRLRLSPENKVQIVFRQKIQSLDSDDRVVLLKDDLVAEITDEPVDRGAFQMAVEGDPRWKLVFKEGNRFFSEDDVHTRTEFFSKYIGITVKKIAEHHFEIRVKGPVRDHVTAHDMVIDPERHSFDLTYIHPTKPDLSKQQTVEAGKFADIRIHFKASSHDLYLLDWSLFPSEKGFDGILIFEADSRNRLPRQVSRYNPVDAVLTEEEYTQHRLRAFYDEEPWVAQQRSAVEASKELWVRVGSTENREDAIFLAAQDNSLGEKEVADVINNEFPFIAEDFGVRRQEFKEKGAARIIQEKTDRSRRQVLFEVLTRHQNELVHFRTVKDPSDGEIHVYDLGGEYHVKGKILPDGTLGYMQDDLNQIAQIRMRGRGIFADFSEVDFGGREVKVITEEKETSLKLGLVIVQRKPVFVEDRIKDLERQAFLATLRNKVDELGRLQREIQRIKEKVEENEKRLEGNSERPEDGGGFINQQPKRKWKHKVIDLEGNVLHTSISSLRPNPKFAPGFWERLGMAARKNFGPPVPHLWSPEIGERQRREVIRPAVQNAKIREINARIRQEGLKGWDRVNRWIDYYQNRMAYMSPAATAVINDTKKAAKEYSDQGLTFDHLSLLSYRKSVVDRFSR